MRDGARTDASVHLARVAKIAVRVSWFTIIISFGNGQTVHVTAFSLIHELVLEQSQHQSFCNVIRHCIVYE